MSPQSNNNNFFGIKVSKPGINVNQASPSQLIYQNDYSAETFYDANGNKAVVLGLQSDGSYGLSMNPGSTTNSIVIGSTAISVYESGVEQIRIGLLPDGTYGMVITKSGISVTTAYGG